MKFILFFRRLDYLLRAGIALPAALEILSGDEGAIGAMSIDLLAHIRRGKTFSDGLASIKGFPHYLLEPIRIGESHGRLGQVCGHLAVVLEQKNAFKKQLVGSLMYPVLIMVMCVALVTGMFFFIVPKMLGIFTSMRMVLPVPTRILLFLYKITSSYWWTGLVVVAILVFIVIILWKHTRCSLWVERALFRMPYLGRLVQDATISNICRTLALLLNTGVPQGRGLEALIAVSRFSIVRESLQSAASNVSTGKSLSDELGRYRRIYPKSALGMLRAGEASGSIADMCEHIADMHEASLRESITVISKLVEPFLMICIGAITAFVALALMMPLYEITSSLHP